MSLAAQQGAVSCVLHQGMFERIFRFRRAAAPKDQFGADKLSQGVLELRLRHLRGGADQFVGELAPEGRRDLRDLARRRQAVEPSQQRGLQRGGDRQRRHPRRRRAVPALARDAAFDDGLRQFLDEQRHAVSPLDDLIGDNLRQSLAASDMGDHLAASSRRQAIEAEKAHMRSADTGRAELRPEGNDRQDSQRRNAVDQEIERFARGRVAPMDVLEHHQHRLARRQPLDLGDLSLKRLLLSLVWTEGERRVASARWNR
ncbi:MAG TPA: hypothetical protein VMI72_14495 [Roseiarcus sp.]|nr:hypothetical protein [Roseiarcus sp.]